MSEHWVDDYSHLDTPQILTTLFHPRPESGFSARSAFSEDVLIPVEKDVVVGARFHGCDKSAANVLFFHGNGEIVADYDDLGALYHRVGVNFLAVDYRGYGRSSGTPSVTAMMKDCRAVFDFTTGWLKDHGLAGALIVMGRSLGSASALELASRYRPQVDGLVLESGFAFTGPLLALLGVDAGTIGPGKGLGNLEKIRTWHKPALIIHAEFDHIIPLSDGRALYEACPSSDKAFLEIPGANHNDIFMKGLEPYLKAVKTLCEKAGRSRKSVPLP